MRYLITLKVLSQPDGPPPAELMDAIFKLGQEATEAGVLLDNSGLAPSSQGARIVATGGRLAVTDGPFAEAKELISYALYQVKTKEEAVEWGSRFIRIHLDLWPGWEGEADVLRLYGPEDFAPPA
ncbi:YciI family protein [Nonomuraea soli]|uniref:YCII-related domain-containing protein n=1 Tax=Nonomuraea soli TaxID=1032476 RepID=A0A7W0CQV6_9ACTN|nr:YciI family protein [Nonomuraea soli]MBA2895533.1 hypothetical protein [Nonomuraea soli]